MVVSGTGSKVANRTSSKPTTRRSPGRLHSQPGERLQQFSRRMIICTNDRIGRAAGHEFAHKLHITGAPGMKKIARNVDAMGQHDRNRPGLAGIHGRRRKGTRNESQPPNAQFDQVLRLQVTAGKVINPHEIEIAALWKRQISRSSNTTGIPAWLKHSVIRRLAASLSVVCSNGAKKTPLTSFSMKRPHSASASSIVKMGKGPSSSLTLSRRPTTNETRRASRFGFSLHPLPYHHCYRYYFIPLPLPLPMGLSERLGSPFRGA